MPTSKLQSVAVRQLSQPQHQQQQQQPPTEQTLLSPDESQQALAIAVVSSLCALSCLIVAARIWLRAGKMRLSLGADDIVMVVAALLNIACSVLICVTTRYGLGRHIEYVSEADKVLFYKYVYATILVYVALIFLIKTSLQLFYLRLSPSRRFNRYCHAYLALNICVFIGCLIPNAIPCAPVSYFWDRTQPAGGTCIQLTKLYLANAIIALSMDVIALVMPIPALMKMNYPRQKKIELLALFGLGTFVCAASAVRITTLVGLDKAMDATWTTVDSHVWSMIEVNIGIIVVCAPTIKPIFTRMLFPSSSTSSSVGKHIDPLNHLPHFHRPPTIGTNGGQFVNGATTVVGGGGSRSLGYHAKDLVSLSTQRFIAAEMTGYGSGGPVSEWSEGSIRKEAERTSDEKSLRVYASRDRVVGEREGDMELGMRHTNGR